MRSKGKLMPPMKSPYMRPFGGGMGEQVKSNRSKQSGYSEPHILGKDPKMAIKSKAKK